ncbi:MFS transporter [Xylella taiwanensis]|uniref:MFS transporter n=1 Tax=Xylella taiwanensis TaxID=1444770 RepID=A0ABS8TWU9_9GAMM|nr:MFS transporter [Xylella taiwanensis]MCD8455692.1 MFS transporter [Xylella taiwanensis]MCD8458099.1 MFS transporter [Xylella taiwanensis]MCD8460234.1 MFS transporter [Xylella taiwanensis]MCD8463708.1 MFS transporter [Xylella taiwanensis]MCD8464736.1 MFS transporter [Xylella taiwanensis]
MEEKKIANNLNHFKTALFGMMILSLGIGIGRFLYTPILPVMLDEGYFTFSQLSYVASAHYTGYLLGSLLFSFGRLGNTSRTCLMLYGAAIVTNVLIFTMAFTNDFFLVMVIRFAAGVASAAMMIFGSITVMRHTLNVWVLASLYAGVGIGILLGNEYVVIGLRHGLNASGLWCGASFLSLILLLLLMLLTPRGCDGLRETGAPSARQEAFLWWQLAVLYSCAGFGYIIVATYLPLMAKTLTVPFFAEHLWSLVGLSIIPSCFAWLWAAHRWGTRRCLTINLLIQGCCVLLTLLSHTPLILVISCIGFGATFMGTTSLVIPLTRRLRAPHRINLVGLFTLTGVIGQILGPLLTGLLHSRSNAIAPAIICGATALFAAAGICQYCPDRKSISL